MAQGAKHRTPGAGRFYTGGNHPGFFLIGLLTALIFPYFSNAINKTDEKKKIVTILTAISDLRRASISYLKVGEIAADGDQLVFFLDNREVDRLYIPHLTGITRDIYFNKYGITGGGEIIIQFSRVYKIVIEKISGRLYVE
jgi:hypothetical protein